MCIIASSVLTHAYISCTCISSFFAQGTIVAIYSYTRSFSAGAYTEAITPYAKKAVHETIYVSSELNSMSDRELPSVVQSQYEPMTATTYGTVNGEFYSWYLASIGLASILQAGRASAKMSDVYPRVHLRIAPSSYHQCCQKCIHDPSLI